MRTAGALAAHPLFAGVDPDLIERVAARAQDRRYDAGETIFREGEPMPGFVVIVEGAISTVPTLAGQASDTGYVHVHTAPTYLGAITLLSGGMQSGSARALEASRVIVVDAESFFDLLRSERGFAREVFSRFAPVVHRLDALRAQQEKLVALGGLAAGLAHELNNPAAAVRRSAAELGTALGSLLAAPAPREPSASSRARLRPPPPTPIRWPSPTARRPGSSAWDTRRGTPPPSWPPPAPTPPRCRRRRPPPRRRGSRRRSAAGCSPPRSRRPGGGSRRSSPR